MPLQLKSLHFLTHNPQGLAHFWAETLNWRVKDRTSDRVELIPSDGTLFNVIFLQDSEKKREKNRLHIDLSTTSLDDQASTVEKLVKLGARHINIGQGPDAPHVVLADPDGNEFCVLEPGNSFVTYRSRLGSITCDGSREVGHFWSKVLKWPLVWDQDEETAIRGPDGTGVFITWGPPVNAKVAGNRLYLEVTPGPTDEWRAEINRLISLGATRLRTDKTSGYAIMSDPDRNEFCVVRSH